MNTTVVVAKSFEEKISDKIKENIGDLIEPADLKRLVEKGIDKFLFERVSVSSNYGSPTVHLSLMEKLVSEHLQKEVREAANTWIKENPERMEKCIKDILQRDVEKVVIQSLSHIFSHPAQMMMDSALQQFKARLG